jgi:hypothetical protein
MFTPAGRLVGDIGAIGSGPGEYRRVSSMGWLGENLWFFDSNQLRITVLTPALRLVRTHLIEAGRPPTPNPRSVGSSAADGHVLGLFADGDRIVRGRMQRPAPAPGSVTISARDSVPVVRVSATHAIRSVVAVVPPDLSGVSYSMATDANGRGGGFGFIVVPFATAPRLAVSPDGSRIAVASVAVRADRSASVQLTVTTSTGAVVYTKPVVLTFAPIPRGVADSAIRDAVKDLRNDSDGMFRMLADEMEKEHGAVVHPPFTDLVIGRDGCAWLHLRDDGFDVQRWLMIDPRGAQTGVVELPRRTSVHAVSATQAWVTRPDSNDFVDVVRMKVVKRAP